MPHKKKSGIAVIISIGKKPKPDMKKYVGDAMPNVMNKAWGFLKALPEQQAFRQTQYHTRPDGSEHYENSPPHTIHPAIAGLMDRTQHRLSPRIRQWRASNLSPDTLRRIGTSDLRSEPRTHNPGENDPGGYPPTYPRALHRDLRINPNTQAEGRIQEIHGLDDEDVETLPPPSGSPQDTIDNLPHPFRFLPRGGLAQLIGEQQHSNMADASREQRRSES
jgi:hypothetical protein